jgi:predicted O-linked N-acetylglucosamine transferase (SPINDLY family)/glycosyltransferase involved in cell wall biosynthesis
MKLEFAPQKTALRTPRVSVVMFCRNGARSIRRSVESVLGQNYPDLEYIVQDGASTDGTLEILQSYGSKIKLESAPDSGTNDGFWRALQRCTGDIISCCLVDEALTPYALERAVQEFRAEPKIGALTGDAYLWNDSGIVFGRHVGQQFDLLAYLFGDYCPNFSASFFRRSALDQIGFFSDRWKHERLESIEFELWCRLGTEHRVKYVPYIFSKYGISDEQMGQNLPRIKGELDARVAIIDKFLFGEPNFFGNDPELEDFVVTRQFEIIINHLKAYRRDDDAVDISGKMEETLQSLRNSRIQRGSSKTIGAPSTKPAERTRRRRFRKAWMLELAVKAIPQKDEDDVHVSTRRTLDFLKRSSPAFLRDRIPQRYKLAFVGALHRRFYRPIGGPQNTNVAVPLTHAEYSRVTFYRRVAEIFQSRGQVDEACRTLANASPLNDSHWAAEACIYMLKSPTATEEDLAKFMQQWADVYTVPNLSKSTYRFPSRAADQKLTIGYHCIFWNSVTGHAQALSSIAKHDRSRFRVIGYSPFKESQEIQSTFDAFEVTGNMNDAQFIDQVRHDNVDIFVELSGLSPYHRFSAMAGRCAPIQVAALNHTSTTRVPNVDYILADQIAAPNENDIYFSEEVYRLPTCFFCFDYNESTLPALTAPPCLDNGYVTFGFFGKSDKINPVSIALWADVIKAVPRSKLLIQNHGMSSLSVRQFFSKQFRWNDVDESRLIFLPGGGRDDVLQNHSRVDICLDSWPYCGGNTIAESIYQGVPVITLHGTRFSAAYGASLITACGMPELIAKTHDEYISVAARLAADQKKLINLRKDLRRMVREYGLGDSGRFARALELAYEDMATRKGVREIKRA